MNRNRRNILFAAAFAVAAAHFLFSPVYGADKWVEVRSPNFVILSDAGEGQARRVAVQFEQIRAVFRDSLSYVRAHASPVITIFAVKDEDSLRELLPEYWDTKQHVHPAGIFLHDGFRFQAAINLAAQGDNPYETLYHEYYHSVTTPYAPHLPLWVTEGLAELYGNSKVGEKQAEVGMLNAGLVQELRQERLIPLDTLFKVDATSPYYNEQKRVSIFYAESWALMHYLLLGDRQAHRQAFGAYLAALSGGATQDEAAAKAFGDLKKLESNLQTYIFGGSSFYDWVVPAPPKIADSELHARQISEAEGDAYRGGFLLAHRQFKAAEPLLEEAAKLDPKLASAQENLALWHYFQQQRPETLASLSAAIDLNPQNALTRYLRASLSIAENDSAAPASSIETDLQEAIAADPNFAPPYALLASYLSNQNERLTQALDLAQKAVSLEPGTSSYRFSVAQVLARMQRYDEAEAIARQARAAATNKQEQDQWDRFFDYLKRAREADARLR